MRMLAAFIAAYSQLKSVGSVWRLEATRQQFHLDQLSL